MGRYWAVGPQQASKENEELIEQMEQFGATPAQIQYYIDAHGAKDCEVLKENESAVSWFLTIDDLFNWAFSSTGALIVGLDVKAVQADAQMRGMDIKPEDYEKVRVIARSAAYHYNNSRS